MLSTAYTSLRDRTDELMRRADDHQETFEELSVELQLQAADDQAYQVGLRDAKAANRDELYSMNEMAVAMKEYGLDDGYWRAIRDTFDIW